MSENKNIQEQLEGIREQIEALKKQLNDIGDKVTKGATEAGIGLEDQLFFSLVFSLALLAITLPALDVGTLFESFGVKLELPTQLLNNRILMVVFLIISSALRYSACVVTERKNKFRALSVGVLLVSFYLLLLDLLIRGLGTFLGKIHFLLLLIPPILVMIFSHFFRKTERKWLRLYGYGEATVSIPIFGVGLFVLITYLLAAVFGGLHFILPLHPWLSSVLIFSISFALCIIILRFYVKRL